MEIIGYSALKLIVALSLATLPAQVEALASDPVFDKVKDSGVIELRGGPSPVLYAAAAVLPDSIGGNLLDGAGRLVGLANVYAEGGHGQKFAMTVERTGEVKPPDRKTVANKDPNPSEWMKRATALQKIRDWRGMLDWCLKWTKSEPKNTDAWHNLGVAYANLKRYNDAIDAYRQAIRINPKDAVFWNNLGIIYDELKRYNDAIDAYRHVIRINPKDVSAWTNLGATCFVSGDRPAALDAVRELRRLDPEKADRLLNAMSR